MKKFKEFFIEAIYKGDVKLNDDIFNYTLKNKLEIYNNNDYKIILGLEETPKTLHLFKKDNLILVSNISFNKKKNKITLQSRKKLDSNESKLVLKLVYTLLSLGFNVFDDYQYNIIGVKVLEYIINDDFISIFYRGTKVEDINIILDDTTVMVEFKIEKKNNDYLL